MDGVLTAPAAGRRWRRAGAVVLFGAVLSLAGARGTFVPQTVP